MACLFIGCDDGDGGSSTDMGGDMTTGAGGVGGVGGMGGMGGVGGVGGVGGMGGDGGEGGEGGGMPGPDCTSYCALMAENCPESFPDGDSCLATCGLYPADAETDATTGNSLQCRTYHASVAAEDGALHCPHAGSNGGGQCGDYCENYCHIAMQTCGDLYADADGCMAECKALPVSDDYLATAGDSVQCRTYHASFPALADGALHCPHAGPDGAGVCGSNCEVYCDRAMTNCDGLYEDAETCMSFCGTFRTDGEPNAVGGNSVQCRTYHANLPAADNADLHCGHASLTGGGVCGDYCEVYCDNQEDFCGDETQYADRGSCMDACSGMNADGEDTAVSGNSVQCRIYHGGYPASLQADLHCSHAGITGGGVGGCGDDPCPAYCDQVMSNCPGAYDSEVACEQACAQMPNDGEWDATAGNSVQCRTYHASFPAAADDDLHCPHAALSGGDVCADNSDSCEFYCDLMENNCGGVYEDRAACLGACAELEPGEPGDIGGDTRECRIYHASFPAAADPDQHCGHAGPAGDGVCVDFTPCETYCGAMMMNCEGYYPDADTCMQACDLFPQDGAPDAQAGNNVQCRAYHAGVAADDAALHCPHASSNGGGVCGDYCENYCHISMQTCNGLYVDEEACMAECAAFPADADANATDGDSVQCRTYHASFPAVANGELHCAHAHPNGGSVCGSQCDVYCGRIMENCPGTYADAEECMNTCAVFPTDGDQGATDGDSVQCRIYHGNLPAAANAELHCPHASLNGGGVCGDYCDVYCNRLEANCGENDAYADRATCLSACGNMPTDGDANSVGGNSVQCRIYHGTAPAVADAGLHCPHASATGSGVCGSECDAYCDQVMASCQDLYPNREACDVACGELPNAGTYDDANGNTVSCRVNAAVTNQCGGAASNGGDQCIDLD